MTRRALLISANGVLMVGALWAFLAPIPLPASKPAIRTTASQPVTHAPFPAVDSTKIPARSLFRPMPPPLPPSASTPRSMPVMAPPPQPAAPPPPPETPLRLVGLIHRSDEVAAFIELGGKREILRRAIGETLEGWTIAEIRWRDIVLTKAGQVRVLPLDPLKAP